MTELRIGVLGAGVMGSGIAQVTATAGFPTVCFDVEPSALGGFWPALGFTLCYLSFFVLLPLAALALRPWELGVSGVWRVLSAPRTVRRILRALPDGEDDIRDEGYSAARSSWARQAW